MLRLIYFLLVVACALSVGCTRSTSQPELFISQPNIDFGNVIDGETSWTDEVITNTGKADLKISAIQTSCSCTGSFLDKDVIKPGESGTMKVRLSMPEMTGEKKEEIVLFTNAPKNETALISVKAFGIKPLEINPAQIKFENVQYGKNTPSQTFHATVARDDLLFEGAYLMGDRDYLSGKIIEVSPHSLKFTLAIKGNAPIGPTSASLYLFCPAIRKEPFRFPVIARINGDFHAATDSIFLGSLAIDKPAISRLKLSMPLSSPLISVIPVSSAKLLNINVTGNQVTVRLVPPVPPGRFFALLRVADKSNPLKILEIPILGYAEKDN